MKNALTKISIIFLFLFLTTSCEKTDKAKEENTIEIENNLQESKSFNADETGIIKTDEDAIIKTDEAEIRKKIESEIDAVNLDSIKKIETKIDSVKVK